MNTYFGLFKKHKIDVSSAEDIGKYMLQSDLFYLKRREVLRSSDSESTRDENANPDVGISEDLINDFYSYLRTILSADIDTPFIIFFDQFNEEVYGLEHIKQKEVGLRDFKSFYNKVKALKGSLGFKVISDNGDQLIEIDISRGLSVGNNVFNTFIFVFKFYTILGITPIANKNDWQRIFTFK